MGIFPTKIHSNIYRAGLILLAVGLPLSVFLMSIAQFVLIINWLLEGQLKKKVKSFFSNVPAMVFSAIFFIHILGLLYTTDFSYAFKDLRIKIPLLLLPLIIATTRPLNSNQFNSLLNFFIAAVVVSSFVSVYMLYFKNFSDIREITPFISHIRFSLMICLSICFLLSMLYNKNFKGVVSFFFIAATMVWLIYFLFLIESPTGLGILSFLLVFFALFIVFKTNNIYKRLGAALFFLAILSATFLYLRSAILEYKHAEDFDFNNLPAYTAYGNPYYHDTTSLFAENGTLVWLFIADDELKDKWEQHSDYDYYGLDNKGQELRATLIRYMASKGLKKDAQGFEKLTESDIRAVEQGIPTVKFFEIGTLKKRIHEILYEFDRYKKTGNPNALSIVMRYKFLKTAWHIITNNFWLGVGTGDVNIAFDNMYEALNTQLEPENRWRAHNQYVSFFVAFGILGFALFLTALIYPPVKLKSFNDYRFLAFFIIVALSMLTEDTLETQAGVTFFAFFSVLFLFGHEKSNKRKSSQQ